LWQFHVPQKVVINPKATDRQRFEILQLADSIVGAGQPFFLFALDEADNMQLSQARHLCKNELQLVTCDLKIYNGSFRAVI
jgi:hypothetical protein